MVVAPDVTPRQALVVRFPTVFAFVAALLLASCGGKLTPTITELPFAPEQRTSGYGAVGGMHVRLVDPSTDHVKRTLRIDASDLQGDFDVASGGAKVTLIEDGGRTFGGVSGTVVIDPIAGSGGASLGTVRVHVDVLLVDSADGSRELHVGGDYDTELAYVG